jgi:hypothetical protein
MTTFHHQTARERFDVWRPLIRSIANVLTINVNIATSTREVAEMTGAPVSRIEGARRLMVFIGALEVAHGRTGRWRLLKDGADLDRAIDLEMERQMRGGLAPETIRDHKKRRGVTRESAEQVAIIEDRIGLPVGAIVGRDRPQPVAQAALRGDGSDAPGALVLAAKQYRDTQGVDDRTRKAQETVAALTELGVDVPDALLVAARPRTDDRLAAIALVLPYVEALERQVVALGDQLRSMADYGELKRYRESHRKQNERDVADRVAQAMREEARRG